MKKVILVACLVPYMAYGQITDNFEQGSLARWKQYPDGRWMADTSESISGNYSMHHIFDNTDAGTDQAGIRIDTLQPAAGLTRWSFRIRHGCDPSASNKWAVFLMSDTDPSADYTDGTNGFAVGINQSGYDDTLRLWKVTGNALTTVVNTHLNWQSSIGSSQPVKIDVERERAGQWNVSVTGSDGISLGETLGYDSELFECKWFIVNYKYTSSRDKLLWFDDLSISGVFSGDPEVPADTSGYSPGDVIISEIMARPEPVVALPPCEYLEITSTTNDTIDLSGWILSTGSTDYPFPGSILNPHEAAIVCSTRDTLQFTGYGKVIGMKSFPALTDYGRLLLLYDKSGCLIHGLNYSSDWYADELKSDGGWSLEMIDTHYPFYFGENWRASGSRTGGTPGMSNSVSSHNPDERFEGLMSFFPFDSTHITVGSPEPVFSFPGMSDSIIIDGIRVSSVILSDPLFRKFTLILEQPLVRHRIYKAEITGYLHDFAGNIPPEKGFSFGLADTCRPGDVLFNELLFNPRPGDPDYIEFYNTSDKVFDVSRLQLISVNDDTGDTSQACIISDDQICFLPHSYYLATVSPAKVAAAYSSSSPNNLFVTSALPSMPDDKGHLILLTHDLVKIDEVIYNEKMHSSLLSSDEGVSLEKINPVFSSGDQDNWRSATENSGWGTPGAPNSVLINKSESEGEITLSSSRITPDDDGVEDVLVISFNLKGYGNVVTATVFDETGCYVGKIASNFSMGQGATLVWDGRSEDGTLLETGIYIILIESYSESGSTHKWKKVCTVIRK